MASIQIALHAKRGVPPRFIEVNTEQLTPTQLRVVREYLPLDKKNGHPILKGLDKQPRSRDCYVPDHDGELKPITFDFDLPPTILEEDAPALLDKWQLLLDQARARRAKALKLAGERELAKQAAGGEEVAKAKTGKGRKGKAKTAEQVDLLASAAAAEQQDQADQADAAAAEQDAAALATEERAEERAEEGAEQEQTIQVPQDQTLEVDQIAGSQEQQGPADQAAGLSCEPTGKAPHDSVESVLLKLPLLKEFEVEPFGTQDALQLPAAGPGAGLDGAATVVRAAVMQILSFDHKQLKMRTILEDLQASLGSDWSAIDDQAGAAGSEDGEGMLVEDLGFRIDQATAAAEQAWADYKQLLADNAIKPTRARKGLRTLAELLELARQIRIDLDTARYTRALLMADMQAHPAWAAQVVQAINEMELQGIDLAKTATLAALHQAFEVWARGLGVIDTNAQLSLWSAPEHERQHRALEHQVGRARQWLDQISRNAAGAIAALAVLGLGC